MKRHIYILLYTLAIGGAERHASSIANYLSQHGFQVTIVLLSDNTIDYSLLPDVEVIALGDLNFPDSVNNSKCGIWDSVRLKVSRRFFPQKYKERDLYLYFQNNYLHRLSYFFGCQPDMNHAVVISFMFLPNIAATVLKRNFHFHAILAEFSSPHLEFPTDSPQNALKRKYYPNADGFIFQTEEQKSFYTYLPHVKMKVIPNPIEKIKTEPFQGVRRKEIVNFCRLVAAKNIPLLVEAFAKLLKDHPDYTLIVYGDGPDRRRIEQRAEELEVAHRVQLRPFAKDVLDQARESAMFVSSSDREGISNSMLEAMAIGLPTICTDCPAGGARMMIRPYENGLIVPVKDPEAMYQAMKYMIEHPAEAQKMGENAVSIRETLEKNKILQQWLDFITEIE